MGGEIRCKHVRAADKPDREAAKGENDRGILSNRIAFQSARPHFSRGLRSCTEIIVIFDSMSRRNREGSAQPPLKTFEKESSLFLNRLVRSHYIIWSLNIPLSRLF